MSEYQYYEWQTIDRPLTSEAHGEVNRLSSHIHVTSTFAQVDYSWGNFKHDPEDVLAQFFDAFLYMANWGSRQLMFRFPRNLLDSQQVAPYCVDYHIELKLVDGFYILKFNMEDEEPGDWIQGEGLLSTLARLRDNILEGDYRVLYLAWLRATEIDYDLDEAAAEPPIPPGLQSLTSGLQAFADFFEIDPLLIKSAAHSSPNMPQQTSTDEWHKAIAGLSRQESDQFLLRLIAGEPRLALELKRRLQPILGEPLSRSAKADRTVGDIHAKRDDLLDSQRAQQRAAAEAKRLKELEMLAPREEATWQEVERLIETSKPKAYDDSVVLLIKLSDLAIYQGKETAFEARIGNLRDSYSRRRSLMDRLTRAGL